MLGVKSIDNKIYDNNISKDNPDNFLDSLKKAAHVHKIVRYEVQSMIRPGIDLLNLSNTIEKKVRTLLDNRGYNHGNGFPTGLSVDNCAAHWTPHYNQSKILKQDSVLKVDFGVQVNNWIIDSAFTIAFDPKYQPLLDAVKEATQTGIKNARIDMKINHWGGLIQEVMESHEVELNQKMYPVKVVKNLTGHNIVKGKIHGGIFLPCFNYPGTHDRFKPGVYAIETFGSTGNGWAKEDTLDNSHYILNNMNYTSSNKKVNLVYNHIKTESNTLPFCDKWVDNMIRGKLKKQSSRLILNQLVKKRVLEAYPPLYDIEGSYVAQYEHTIYLSDGKTQILSEGLDY